MSLKHVLKLWTIIVLRAENRPPKHKRPPCTDGLLKSKQVYDVRCSLAMTTASHKILFDVRVKCGLWSTKHSRKSKNL